MKAKLLSFGKLSLSFILFYLLIRRVAWKDIFNAFLGVNIYWFFFAILAGFSQILISAWRWQRVLVVLGSSAISIPKLINIYLFGFFFNNFAPANIAGDLARVGVLYQGGNTGKIGSVSVLIERIANLIGLGIIALWAIISIQFPLKIQLTWSLAILLACILLGVLVLLYLFALNKNPKDIYFTNLRIVTKQIYKRNRLEFVKILIGTMLLHFVIMLITYFNSKALLIDLPIHIQFAVYGISGLAIAIPISFQGVGIRESIYTYLFGAFGIPASQVLAAMALNYFLLILFSLPGGLLFIARRRPSLIKGE